MGTGREPMLWPGWWWFQVRQAWRVLLAVIVVQELGGLVGLLVGVHHSSFMNHWVGGALATPIGFVAGLVWQLADPERRRLTSRFLMVFLGVLAIGLGVNVAFYTTPRLQGEMDRLNALAVMDATGIERISVFDRYGRRSICDIENPVAIAQFAEACRDVKGNTPNHPVYTTSWHVVLQGPEPRELECHYERGRPGELVGYFIHKVGNSTRYTGSFSSKQLRTWFQGHVQRPAS